MLHPVCVIRYKHVQSPSHPPPESHFCSVTNARTFSHAYNPNAMIRSLRVHLTKVLYHYCRPASLLERVCKTDCDIFQSQYLSAVTSSSSDISLCSARIVQTVHVRSQIAAANLPALKNGTYRKKIPIPSATSSGQTVLTDRMTKKSDRMNVSIPNGTRTGSE